MNFLKKVQAISPPDEADEETQGETFKYHWMHLPTGKQGEKSQKFHSEKDFMNELNHWNELGGKLWKYWI
jgi:hypothetical protein